MGLSAGALIGDNDRTQVSLTLLELRIFQAHLEQLVEL